MSTTSITNNEPKAPIINNEPEEATCASQAAEFLDKRLVRHTIGRIDSIFRTCVAALLLTLQLAKVVIKGMVCIFTLGQLYRIKSLENIWDLHGLATDLEWAVIGGYYMLLTARDIIVAPHKHYASAVRAFATGFTKILLSNYSIYGQKHGLYLKTALEQNRFFTIIDKLPPPLLLIRHDPEPLMCYSRGINNFFMNRYSKTKTSQ